MSEVWDQDVERLKRKLKILVFHPILSIKLSLINYKILNFQVNKKILIQESDENRS